MESLYFVGIAIVLYFVADRLLRLIESVAGRVLEYRSLVFFGLLLTLALGTFAIIRRFVH